MSLFPRLRPGLVACGPALLSVAATAGTIVVRQDGGGSTTTIQAAIDGSGRLYLPAVWPASSTSGTSAYAQVWVVDPHGPSGFAATNGLSATSP